MQGAVPSRHPKYRTKLCRNLASGDCPFGQKCSFIHPMTGADPATSLAQYLFNWNALFLPQLLALSNQQSTLKEMPRRSQGPQLVAEDPSPRTSLLLSKSDSTSSEQVSQTRRSNRRKKTPCRHFLRTGGWCPAAGKCRFFHDVAALSSADVRKTERTPPFVADAHAEGGRSISGGVLMGMQSPSPPIVDQTHPEPHPEAEQTRSYQPMYWPNCTWQPYQPYYATVVPTAAVPVPTAAAPSSLVPQGVYPPPQPQAQAAPPDETQSPSHFPLGSYEVNGTTYFAASMPSVPAPPPMSYQIPAHPLPYNHSMAPVYPYYTPPTMPAGYYDIPNQTMDSGSQTTFDPFASDPMKPSELPFIPRLEDYPMSPVQQIVLPSPPSAVVNGDPGVTNADKPTATQEHEFPYRPPKDQRVGHARRISVNIKKHARVNSG